MIDKLLNEFLIAFLVENKTVILMGCGFILYSALEYSMGEGDHGSLIGFIKFVMKKKNDEPKA